MIRRRSWTSGFGMVAIVALVLAAGVAFYKANRIFVTHRLEAQGYHVTDLSLAWINKHPFWCSGSTNSKGEHDSPPIYTFTYTANGQTNTGFACEQGWIVYAWPNTDYSFFN